MPNHEQRGRTSGCSSARPRISPSRSTRDQPLARSAVHREDQGDMSTRSPSTRSFLETFRSRRVSISLTTSPGDDSRALVAISSPDGRDHLVDEANSPDVRHLAQCGALVLSGALGARPLLTAAAACIRAGNSRCRHTARDRNAPGSPQVCSAIKYRSTGVGFKYGSGINRQRSAGPASPMPGQSTPAGAGCTLLPLSRRPVPSVASQPAARQPAPGNQMSGRKPDNDTSPVEVAVAFMATQPGGPERTLAQHRHLSNGLCSGCLHRAVAWPCSVARIAALAEQHPSYRPALCLINMTAATTEPCIPPTLAHRNTTQRNA